MIALLVVTFQTTALCVPYASIGFEVDPFVLNTPTAFNVTTVPPNIFFNFNVEVIVLSYVALVNVQILLERYAYSEIVGTFILI